MQIPRPMAMWLGAENDVGTHSEKDGGALEGADNDEGVSLILVRSRNLLAQIPTALSNILTGEETCLDLLLFHEVRDIEVEIWLSHLQSF